MSAGGVVVVGVGAVVDDGADAVVVGAVTTVVVGALTTVVVDDEVLGVVVTVVPTGFCDVGGDTVLVGPAPGEATAQAEMSRVRPRDNERARLMEILSHDGGCHR
jgi:hypothetical protein